MKAIEKVDPEIFSAIQGELRRERETLILIASENYAPPEVLEAQGSVFTNKYAEGYPGARYYGGCQFADAVERIAIDRAKALFGAEHANVQPHSGTSANMAVYFSVLEPGDVILGMDLAHGGHLSHGSKVSFSGEFFKVYAYGVSRETERIDMEEVRDIALKVKPRLIIAGASSYPMVIDFDGFRKIADEVGAYLLTDMAHFAGLVAGGVYPNPTPNSHFVTFTTHKTMRGPRGGVILCKAEFSKAVDRAVFPGIQGGPLVHVIAAKAVCFKNASGKGFKEYAKRVVENAKTLSDALKSMGYRIVAGGTETHLFLVDLGPMGITGMEAEVALEKAGMAVNKNMIPFDKLPPNITSGIRLGTPAVTSRGMGKDEMELIAELIDFSLKNRNNDLKLKEVREKVKGLLKNYPVYGDAY